MKILFLVFHGFSDHSGITKKIRGQVKGLEENNHSVDLAYYEMYEDDSKGWVVAGQKVASLGKGVLGKLRKRIDFGDFQRYIIAQAYDLIYIRSYHNANPFTIDFVRGLRKNKSKVVIEIPTYPYDEEYQSLSVMPELYMDKLFRKELMRQVDAVVTFSNDSEIFGQRAIQISNGIDFDHVPLRHVSTVERKAIHLLGVAEIHYWHGFDRMVKGLGEYLLAHPTEDIFFHIVGEYSGSREREEIEREIAKYGLQKRVILHGALFGDQLNQIFDDCDFAIGSLGRHRTGIAQMRSLKNREYAARGIPFAYAESDPDFDHQPYIVKYAPDETLIDVGEIINYLREQYVSAEDIRSSILHLSWRCQMQIVIKELFK